MVRHQNSKNLASQGDLAVPPMIPSGNDNKVLVFSLTVQRLKGGGQGVCGLKLIGSF